MLSVTDVVRKVRDRNGSFSFTPDGVHCDVNKIQQVVLLVLEADRRGFLLEVIPPHRSSRGGPGGGLFDMIVASGVTDSGHRHLEDEGFPPLAPN